MDMKPSTKQYFNSLENSDGHRPSEFYNEHLNCSENESFLPGFQEPHLTVIDGTTDLEKILDQNLLVHDNDELLARLETHLIFFAKESCHL